MNHRVSTITPERVPLQSTSLCYASPCEIASRLRVLSFSTEWLLSSRSLFRNSVRSPTSAETKLLRQHADFDREVLQPFSISTLGSLEAAYAHIPSIRRIVEVFGAFVIGNGCSERHEVSTTTLLSQLQRQSIVAQMGGKALFFSAEKQLRTVFKVLFATSRHFCAVSPAPQLLDNFKFIRSFFNVLAACPTSGPERMRHLLHHLTFRVVDTPNTWVCGNELLQLLLVFLSDTSSNLPAAESLLRAMEQHFSSPSISQHTSMVKSILLHVPLSQLVDALQVNHDSQLSVVSSCEKQSLGAATLPQPRTITLKLLPETYNAQRADLSLHFIVECSSPAFGTIQLSTTDQDGKHGSVFSSFPIVGVHGHPYHCSVKCRKWSPLFISAAFSPIGGSAASVFIQGDIPVSPYVSRLSFSRFILTSEPCGGRQFAVSGITTVSHSNGEKHLRGASSLLYSLVTGEQFTVSLTDVTPTSIILTVTTTSLSLLGEVSLFLSN